MSVAKRRWPRLAELHTIAFDFDGVFTDNKVYVMQNGMELVRCDRADGLAVDLLRRYRRRKAPGLDVLIISTERNPVVAARARKLRLTCRQAVGDKLTFLETYLRRRHSRLKDPFAGLLYVGNDLNDLPIIRRAGFSIAPRDAHAIVRRAAGVVLPQNGGEGFVRALVERLLGVDALTVEDIDELVLDR
ncbi:MAG: KdsC family phosphatase [bacterium]